MAAGTSRPLRYETGKCLIQRRTLSRGDEFSSCCSTTIVCSRPGLKSRIPYAVPLSGTDMASGTYPRGAQGMGSAELQATLRSGSSSLNGSERTARFALGPGSPLPCMVVWPSVPGPFGRTVIQRAPAGMLAALSRASGALYPAGGLVSPAAPSGVR
jgi:hypothetical protein